LHFFPASGIVSHELDAFGPTAMEPHGSTKHLGKGVNHIAKLFWVVVIYVIFFEKFIKTRLGR